MSSEARSKSLALTFLAGAFIIGGIVGFVTDRAVSSPDRKTATRAYTVRQGRDELAKELGLSAPQRAMLDSILDWRNERDNALMQPIRPLRDANRDSARTLILQHLDPAQKEKFLNMIDRMRTPSTDKNQQ